MTKNSRKKKPLISVIVNCFNGAKYLKEAIDSVLNQNYKNWEIIFWDNCSTDKSADIIKTYKDKRIKYYYSKLHSSLYQARNLAFKKSSGDFICFLDVDDYFLEGFFEKQLKLFNDKSIGFACANHFYKDEKKNKFWIRFKRHQVEGYVLSELLLNYTVSLSTLFIKRSALSNLKTPFDRNYTYLGDFDLVIKLSANFKMARCHEPLSVYRLHDKNLSIRNYYVQLKELKNWRKKVIKIDQIKNDKNFKNITNLINYKKLIIAFNEKKLIKIFLILNNLPWSFRKLKYILLTLLIFVFKIKLKNFRL